MATNTYWAERRARKARKQKLVNGAVVLSFLIGFPLLVFGLARFDCHMKVRFYEAYQACAETADCTPTKRQTAQLNRDRLVIEGCRIDLR